MKKSNKLWNKNFLLLWQGTLFSTIGDVLYSICIGFWVYEKTGSTSLMGLLSSISMLVSVFLGPICGALVDRSSRKWMIVNCDALRGVLMIGLGLIALNNHMEVWMVLVTAFIAALCNAFFTPASMSILPDLVPSKEMVRAQSLSAGGRSLVNLVGKGISGAFIAFFGVPIVILFNGVSLLFSAFTELFIEDIRLPKSTEKFQFKSLIRDLKQGAIEIMNDSFFRIVCIISLSANFFSSGMGALMLPFCLTRGLDVTQYGLLMSIQSVAALIGTLLLGVFQIKAQTRLRFVIYGFPLSSLLMAIMYCFTTFNTLGSTLFIASFLNTAANTITNATFLLLIPSQKRALYTSFIMTASCLGIALSSIIFGIIGEFIDLGTLGAISSLISVLPLLVLTFNKKLHERFLNAEDYAQAAELQQN